MIFCIDFCLRMNTAVTLFCQSLKEYFDGGRNEATEVGVGGGGELCWSLCIVVLGSLDLREPLFAHPTFVDVSWVVVWVYDEL